MKISVKREGGLMGIPAKANINFEDLTAEDRLAMEEIMNTPAEKPNGYNTRDMPAPDAYAYEFKFKKGTKNTVLKFDDASLPMKVYLILEKYLK